MSIFNPYESAGVTLPSTTTTTCAPTYVSITLNAGNSFVLPPGATLVAVSDKDKVQSDCFDVNTLEEFACYKFTVSGACNDEPGGEAEEENWEVENTYINGFYIGSTKYSTNTELPFGLSSDICPDTNIVIQNFETSLEQTALDGVIKFVELDNNSDNCDCSPGSPLGEDRGWTVSIIFETIPSIANTLMMELYTITQSQDQPSPQKTFIRIVPISVTCPTTTTTAAP